MQSQLSERFQELARRAGLTQPPRAAVLVVLAAVVVAVAWTAIRMWPGTGDVIVDPAGTTAAAETSGEADAEDGDALVGDSRGAFESADTTAAGVAVHVVGAVNRPGLYSLGAGARVADAVAAASGLSPEAAEEGVNLARAVQDGEQIVVPTVEELENGTVRPPAAGGSPTSGGGTVAPGQRGTPSTSGAPVNLNTADAATLETLPGIGPATAQKIVADRDAHGPFGRTEDLARVSGIGPKKLEALSGLIVVR